ncbi:type 4a pilus biogenesis protein PilO [Pseudomonas sp. NFXW11]|uniref:type 4a pilus biogenesis protein PilO n=1 Tax=Pseudomonas sp. NFXW11 TaxID=2819531 RepID=UPI003CF10C36
MSLEQWLAEWRCTDMRALELQDPGSWPGPVQALAATVLLLSTLLCGYLLYLSPHLQQVQQQRQEQARLVQQFAAKALQGAGSEGYRQQLEIILGRFDTLLRQLPGESEVPGLLEDISRLGLGAGLAFEEIRLQPERPRQFYVELPMQITLVGSYHDLAAFVAGVAGLPRIVTLHDFRLRPLSASNPDRLRMGIEARTYRYDKSPEPPL